MPDDAAPSIPAFGCCPHYALDGFVQQSIGDKCELLHGFYGCKAGFFILGFVLSKTMKKRVISSNVGYSTYLLRAFHLTDQMRGISLAVN